MEYQKIRNLLGTTSDNVPKFITKILVKAYHQFGGSYNTSKQIRFKTSMLKSNLCDYNDAYIVVKGTIRVTRPTNNITIRN